MQAQKEKVLSLEDDLRYHQVKLRQLEARLKEEKEVLQEICERDQLHEYIGERDDDYHRPGWYYTCKHCGHFTRMRPTQEKN